MLSLVPPVTPRQRLGVSFSDVLETDELQMIAAAYVSSPGPAEESAFDLFPPSSSSALQLTLADGRALFVPGSSAWSCAWSSAQRPWASRTALGLCFLAHSSSQTGQQCTSKHGLWYRLCILFLCFIQQRGVTAEHTGLL